jgi:hypothetical protein
MRKALSDGFAGRRGIPAESLIKQDEHRKPA